MGEGDETEARPEPGHRRADLPSGGTLVVRPVRAEDADALADLYAGFTVDDLRRRFFSVFRPDRRFIERVVSTASRGGVELVAEVSGTGDGEDRIVGEAGYELLPNGDGELAITVAPRWRGWVGPYLLDALVEAAAARGVPNLEAEVLVTNASMLSLLRARGYVTMGGDDWTTVRAVISTSGRIPSWPERHDRPRILVEVPGARWHATPAAERAGLELLACPGPLGSRTRCPALRGEPCPLAAGADVIVVSHAGDDPRWDELVAAHRRLHPGVPVCVERPGRAGTPIAEVAATREGGTAGATTGEAGAGATAQEDRAGMTAARRAVVAFVERLARPRPQRGPGGERGSAPPGGGSS